MCPAAWAIFIHTLRLSCLLLFLSVALLIKTDAVFDYSDHMLAVGLYETPQALLLIASIGSAIIDELQSGRV